MVLFMEIGCQGVRKMKEGGELLF